MAEGRTVPVRVIANSGLTRYGPHAGKNSLFPKLA